MTKEGFAMGVMGFMVAVGLSMGVISGNDDELVTQEITIKQGETLYQVVANTVSNKNNINEVVSKALRDNGIQSAGDIQPNQKITIVYKK